MTTNKRLNMSDFLAGLNGPVPEPQPEFDDSLLFQTTDFLNFDFGESGSIPREFENQDSPSINTVPTWDTSSPTDFLDNNGNFQFNMPAPSSNNAISNAGHYKIPDLGHQTSQQSPTSSTSSSARRKGSEISDPALSLEERTRFAAEEDKRKRNTAASARFRVKKKQKEQALEKLAKEMSDKCSKLEKRVSELETENRWLKGLLTDKGDGESDKLTEMFAKFREAEQQMEGEVDE